MLRRIASGIVWALDWYLRAEWAIKAMVAAGLGLSVFTAIGTFLVTVKRGSDPLLAIFIALLALMVVGSLTLIALEVRRQWPSQKDKHLSIAGDNNAVNLGRDQTTVHVFGPTYLGSSGTTVNAALYEAQLKELRDLDNFIGKKDEHNLRELFDFNRTVRFNVLLAKHQLAPSRVPQPLLDEMSEVFKGGNGQLERRFVRMKEVEGTIEFEAIPGTIGLMNTTKRYAEALNSLKEFETSAIMPSDVKSKITLFRTAVEDNISLMFGVLNGRLSSNKNNLLEAEDPMSKRAYAINNAYWEKFDNLRPRADVIAAAVRQHLNVT